MRTTNQKLKFLSDREPKEKILQEDLSTYTYLSTVLLT